MTTNNYLTKAQLWARRGGAAICLAGASALLGSCGGGGVASDTGIQVGTLALLPASGSLFANVPFTFTVAGGRKPYFLTSSEQTLVPLNYTLEGNTFVVVPNNPGVVDPVTDPNIVPSRSIRFTVRDAAGTTITTGDTSFSVVQNFILGYNLSISALFGCGVDDAGKPLATEACVGSESEINLRPTTAGVLYRNRPLRLSINYGQFLFIDKNSSPPNQAVSSLTLTTSGSTVPGGTEAGSLKAFLRPLDTARTQYAGLRITDVQSGVYRDVDFVIVNNPLPSAPIPPLVVLPGALGPLPGRDNVTCGTGQINARISGGTPPYSVTVSPSLAFTVTATPTTVFQNAGVTTISVGPSAPPNCIADPNAVTIRDASGQAATFGVTTTVGTIAPNQPLSVIPTSIACLANGDSTPLGIIGGNTLKIINSRIPALASVAPSSLTGASGTATIKAEGSVVSPATVGVVVSDGTNEQVIQVTRQCTCTPGAPCISGLVNGTCVADGATLSFTVTGGADPKTVTSANPSRLTVAPASITGAGTVVLTAAGAISPATPATSTPVDVTVSNSAGTQTFTIVRKLVCP